MDHSDTSTCDCRPAFDGDRLVGSDDCAGRGLLASTPDCRVTVIDTLTERDVKTIITRSDGVVRVYEDGAAALLVAAGRFVDTVVCHDGTIAARARRDPIRAARKIAGRGGSVARIGAETGFIECDLGNSERTENTLVASRCTMPMITTVDDPGSLTPDELHHRYDAALRETIEELGAETVSERTGIDREHIDAIAAGEASDIELQDAAAILATRDGRDGETIAAEARDELLIGMTSAVLDVDTLESEIDGQMEARTIQQKIEGRFPMTLAEYALLRQRIEERSP